MKRKSSTGVLAPNVKKLPAKTNSPVNANSPVSGGYQQIKSTEADFNPQFQEF